MLIESDEAWALYDPFEKRYRWHNQSFTRQWGMEPLDPWTLFAIPPGAYHGTQTHDLVEIAIRIHPDREYYWVHTRDQNLPLYRAAFHSLPVALSITKLEGALFIDTNQTAREFSGYLPGASTMSLWRDTAQREYYIRHLQAHGMVRQMPFPFYRPDGQPLESITSSGLFSHRDQSYLISTLGSPPPNSNLLHTKSELLQQIFEYAPALIVLSDDSGRMRKVNRFVGEVSGFTPEELEGRPFYELIPEEERQRVQDVVEECFHESHVTYSENHWVTRTGERRLLQWSNTRLNSGFNNEIVHVGIGQDVTEQRQAEQKFRNLVDNAPDAILEIEADGTVAFINPAARYLFGNILKTPILNRVHEDDWAAVAEQMQKPRTEVRCRMLHCQDGWRWFDCKGQAGILICRDVTAELQSEEMHKMQAVASVAASLAQKFLELHDKLDDQEAMEEARRLAKKLLKLNQEAQSEPERATLEDIMEGAVTLLTASLSKVRVQLQLNTRESWLTSGRTQIEQMLLNLGLSAVHPGSVLNLSTHPAPEGVELRASLTPNGNPFAPTPLDDKAVILPGDPLRVFFPLVG
ncbi:MAG: PAS domain S-box protein [Candidatus Eremiobacteraeota bacterium]|nr:PAS domain S-box protein [Candidatus Eremiobacteraeota bacterium]